MQQKIALAYIKQLGDAKIFPAPIVTRVEANGGFSLTNPANLANGQQFFIMQGQ